MSFSEDFDHYEPEMRFSSVGIGDRKWIDKFGKAKFFEELKTSHLENILNMLEESGAEIPIMLLVELRLRKQTEV